MFNSVFIQMSQGGVEVVMQLYLWYEPSDVLFYLAHFLTIMLDLVMGSNQGYLANPILYQPSLHLGQVHSLQCQWLDLNFFGRRRWIKFDSCLLWTKLCSVKEMSLSLIYM